MNARSFSIILALMVLFIGLPLPVAAHSNISSSIPADGETVEEALESLELSFDGGIEQGSTAEVTNEAGEVIEPGAINVESSQLVIEFNEPLKNGQYNVYYQVISADTHPVEGEISFTVDAEELAEPAEEEATEDQITTEEGTEEETTETEEVNPSTEDEETTNNESNTVLWVVGAIAVIAIVVIGLIVARKKK